MPKITSAALKAKVKVRAWTFEAKANAKAIKFGLEVPMPGLKVWYSIVFNVPLDTL